MNAEENKKTSRPMTSSGMYQELRKIRNDITEILHREALTDEELQKIKDRVYCWYHPNTVSPMCWERMKADTDKQIAEAWAELEGQVVANVWRRMVEVLSAPAQDVKA